MINEDHLNLLFFDTSELDTMSSIPSRTEFYSNPGLRYSKKILHNTGEVK